MDFDSTGAYEVDPRVAIRPEPFGALAYHYGNRRLTFLRDPALVSLVRDLGSYPSADEAIEGVGIAPSRRPSFRKALANLSAAEVIRAR